jgi:hypothetical protein
MVFQIERNINYICTRELMVICPAKIQLVFNFPFPGLRSFVFNYLKSFRPYIH